MLDSIKEKESESNLFETRILIGNLKISKQNLCSEFLLHVFRWVTSFRLAFFFSLFPQGFKRKTKTKYQFTKAGTLPQGFAKCPVLLVFWGIYKEKKSVY